MPCVASNLNDVKSPRFPIFECSHPTNHDEARNGKSPAERGNRICGSKLTHSNWIPNISSPSLYPPPHLPWTPSLVIVCLNESMLSALCVDLIMFNSLAHSLFISVTVSAYFCRKSGSVGILVNSLVKFEFDPIFECARRQNGKSRWKGKWKTRLLNKSSMGIGSSGHN